jgi:hypothetical protein
MAHYNHLFSFVQKKKERTFKPMEPAGADGRQLVGAPAAMEATAQQSV